MFARLAFPLLAAAVAGCTSIAYYGQAARGEYQLLSARQPIAALLANPETPAGLHQRLQTAAKARAFASAHLDLPRNASYTTYAALGRKYVVWNVYATPPFSIRAISHCFPVAGCVAYQGYFHHKAAQAAAERWRARGDDAAIFGAPTFSTLGWFADPVLSTMLRWGDGQLAGEIFHELAHQKYYVKGDTQFNESYANFVQREGLRQWRHAQHLPPTDHTARKRADAFSRLMLEARAQLARVYASGQPDMVLRARKADVFARLKARYRKLRNNVWGGYDGYDAFFSKPLNNASLVPFGLYDKWVPGFRKLFDENSKSWPQFFAAVARLGAQSKARRDATMKKLTQAAS